MDVLPVTARPEEVLREALAAMAAGATVALATVVARHGSAPATPGQKLALVDRGATAARRFDAFGTVGGGAIERVVLAEMATMLALATSAPKMHTFRLGPSLGMCCGGSADVLIEPLRPAISVLLVGAGHVGLSTAPLLSSLGFRVILVDARAEAGARERVGDLPGVRFVSGEHDDPEVLEAIGADPENALCVVMTHDHQLDQSVLEWAVTRRFRFIGGVGSRAKAERTRQRLEAKGFPEADRARIRMPVGLEIGARRPVEIAVAIGAELVRVRAEMEGLARFASSADRDRADAPSIVTATEPGGTAELLETLARRQPPGEDES